MGSQSQGTSRRTNRRSASRLRQKEFLYFEISEEKKMDMKRIIAGYAMATAVVLGFTACSEKIEGTGGDDSQSIGIGVAVKQGWDEPIEKRNARFAQIAAKKAAAGVKDVLAFNESFEGKTLYLWCDEIDGISGKGHSITVESDENADEQTRGTLMSGDDGSGNFAKSTFYDNFDIYGEKATSGTSANYKPGSVNDWTLTRNFTWSDDNNYTFYGVAPASAAGVNASTTGLTYNTPLASTAQQDIMVGPSTAKRTDRKMLFDFKHVLSAVRFKLGSDFATGYTIKKIELTNVSTQGTYTFSTGNWVNTNPNTVYANNLNFVTTNHLNSLITSDGTPNDPNDIGTTFVLLPQTLGSNSYAIITLEDNENPGTDLHFHASLNGQTWEKGHAYTYTIANTPYKSEFTFEVENNPEFTYDGKVSTTPTPGTNQFKVVSYYRGRSGAAPEPVAWTITGYEESTDNGATWTSVSPTAPDWLTNISKTSGAGDTGGGETFTTAVEGQESLQLRRQGELRSRPTKGTADAPYDLSLYKVDNETSWGGRSTANCYIVRQGGYYKIPLVMGNTITRGKIYTPEKHEGIIKFADREYTVNDNKTTEKTDKYGNITTPATPTQVSGSYVYGSDIFVDYNNQLVTAANYKVEATKADVYWHDFQHTGSQTELIVIKDVNVVSDNSDPNVDKYLTFTVDPKTIQQGNAVIVVRNAGGTITWSWHIYVTDRNWLTEVTDTKTRTWYSVSPADFTMANYNLGFVEMAKNGSTYTYPRRIIRVTFQQEKSGTTCTRTITQKEGTVPANFDYFWDTKYQWGRKDAFPGNGVGTTAGDQEGSPSSGWLKSGSKTGPYKCKYYPEGTYNPGKDVSGGATYGYAIQHPAERIRGSGTLPAKGMWSNQFYANAWSATETIVRCGTKTGSGVNDPKGDLMYPLNSVNPVVKTIYDPCPAGFKVPPSGVFSNFSKSGNSATGTNRNISGSFSVGYNFYAIDTSGTTLFFPAAGRLQDSGLRNYLTNSWVWSATPGVMHDVYGNTSATRLHSATAGMAGSFHLSFTNEQVNPGNHNQSTMPQSVRPIVDTHVNRIYHDNTDIRPNEDGGNKSIDLN